MDGAIGWMDDKRDHSMRPNMEAPMVVLVEPLKSRGFTVSKEY